MSNLNFILSLNYKVPLKFRGDVSFKMIILMLVLNFDLKVIFEFII